MDKIVARLKLSEAIRLGGEGVLEDLWWFRSGARAMHTGDNILYATGACLLGCAYLGALKSGVDEHAPRSYGFYGTQDPGLEFTAWLKHRWPELEMPIDDPEPGTSGTLWDVLLQLNGHWSREKVIEWLEGVGL